MDFTMTPEEKKRFNIMERDIRDIVNAIKGDPLHGHPGFSQRLKSIEEALSKVESKIKRLTILAMGIGIGFLIAGVIFGIFTWREVLNFVK